MKVSSVLSAASSAAESSSSLCAGAEAELLRALEPVVAENLARHLALSKPWMPHAYVPWQRGRDFAQLGGQDWSEKDSQMSPLGRAAALVNLLTEDNLPSYHREISLHFGAAGSWRRWIGRWTAEEGRHGLMLRDYLLVTRAVDPNELEALRMETVTEGYYASEKSAVGALVYVALQEMATRVAHRNTGKLCGCANGERIFSRIAADENLHMVFYRNLVAAAFDLMPDLVMEVLEVEVRSFQMPGVGVPGFRRYASLIALAGIYDLRLHLQEVLSPMLDFWSVFGREDLSARGEKARDALRAFLDDLERTANQFVEQRARFLRTRSAPLG